MENLEQYIMDNLKLTILDRNNLYQFDRQDKNFNKDYNSLKINMYKTVATDFAIVTGAEVYEKRKTIIDDVECYYSKTWIKHTNRNTYCETTGYGNWDFNYSPACSFNTCVRPAFFLTGDFFDKMNNVEELKNLKMALDNTLYSYKGYSKKRYLGEYPQDVVNQELEKKLEDRYNWRWLDETGRYYQYINEYHNYYQLTEYLYEGNRYVRVKSIINNDKGIRLSNGKLYRNGDIAWIEVKKVAWLQYVKHIVGGNFPPDESSWRDPIVFVSEKALASGHPLSDEGYDIFERCILNSYLEKYLTKEIIDEELKKYDKETFQKIKRL